MAGTVRHYHSKIVGVTHANPDGTDRQWIISQVQQLEKLVLEHDEHNVHDPNAVKVCREDGQQLGFLGRDLAREVIGKTERGIRFACFVKNVTGGGSGRPNRGVNILIIESDPDVSDHDAQRYVDAIDLSDADIRRDPSLDALAEASSRRPVRARRRKPARQSGCAVKILIIVALSFAAYVSVW